MFGGLGVWHEKGDGLKVDSRRGIEKEGAYRLCALVQLLTGNFSGGPSRWPIYSLLSEVVFQKPGLTLPCVCTAVRP